VKITMRVEERRSRCLQGRIPKWKNYRVKKDSGEWKAF
jgi:hypothetical protein